MTDAQIVAAALRKVADELGQAILAGQAISRESILVLEMVAEQIDKFAAGKETP